MSGTDNNLAEVVYEEVYAGALQLGISQPRAHDLAQMADSRVRKRCGRSKMYVPMVNRSARNQRIVDRYRAGEFGVDIAREEGVSIRTVWRVLKAHGVIGV